MLPNMSLERTNFADGMIFNPEQIKHNDTYFLQKNALISRYGLGKGILLGFKSNLRVAVENSQLVLHPGAAIDRNGDLLYIPVKQLLLKDLGLTQFKDNTSLYIYVHYKETLTDGRESRKGNEQKHFYKSEESFNIEIREKAADNSDYLELARIYIAQSSGSIISEAINPYSPSDNEINLRFCYKSGVAYALNNHNEKIMIANVFRKYADSNFALPDLF